MNAGIVGYGRMGHAIEQVLLARGHRIAWIIDQPGDWERKAADLSSADVAIEFSVPGAAFDNLSRLLHAGIPVVTGTTGWKDKLPDLAALCTGRKGALLHSSNFSPGVNLLFELNRLAAAFVARFPEFGVCIQETHHIHKVDSPSGTALTLIEDMLAAHPRYTRWQEFSEEEISGVPDDTLAVLARREGEVFGIHEVNLSSPQDILRISHEARGREGFATGAVLAAEWLQGRTGVYTMRDVLFPDTEKQ